MLFERTESERKEDIIYLLSMAVKGLVHQLDKHVLIKGQCRCDQNAIGIVTFESWVKEKSAYLFLNFQK